MPFVLEPYRQQIAALCRRCHVRRLEVCGSALRDDFDRRAAMSISWLSLRRAWISTSSKLLLTYGHSGAHCWVD